MYESIKTNKLTGILFTLSFIFIILISFIILNTPSASGYEISIYRAFPWYLWTLLIASLICGIGILLNQAHKEGSSRWWLSGLSIIILTNTIFLNLPLFRGYFIYGRGDTLTHLGWMKDIITTGHIGNSNFYPAIHILGVNLIHMTGVPLNLVPYLLWTFFSIIYIINMYLLGRTLSGHQAGLLILAFSSPLIYSSYHTSIHPSFFSLFLIPLLLCFYHRLNKISFNRIQNIISMLMVAVLINFFHPVTTLLTIIILTIFILYGYFSRKFLQMEFNLTFDKIRNIKNLPKTVISFPRLEFGQNTKVLLFSILVVLFFFGTWYSSSPRIQKSFNSVMDEFGLAGPSEPTEQPSIKNNKITKTKPSVKTDTKDKFSSTDQSKPPPDELSNPSIIKKYLNNLSRAGLTFNQIIELFINRYGAVSIMFLFFFGGLVYTLKNKFPTAPDNILFTYVVLFLITFFIGITMIFNYFIVGGLIRALRFGLLMGSIFSGLFVYNLIKSDIENFYASYKNLINLIVVGIIISAIAALSIGNVYDSPRTYQPNVQTTQMEIEGIEWFGRQEVSFPLTVNEIITINRFEDYILGQDIPHSDRTVVSSKRLPSHFGYDRSTTLAEALGFKDRYVALSQYDKSANLAFPENVRPKAHKWIEEDLNKINSDSTVSKFYDNDGFWVWRVYGRGS